MSDSVVRIRIKVTPDARREYVREGVKGVLEVSIKEPAAGNRANMRALELVASHLQVRRNALRIVQGHRGRVKILEVYAS